MTPTIQSLLNHLLFQSGTVQDLGLFHGKTGIAMALYLYARQTADTLVEDCAWELLSSVYDGIHSDMPLGLERGLAGIGYGVTLLCREGILEGDLNSILSEVDAKIMERDPRRVTDFSVRTGVRGLQLYLDLRQQTQGTLESFDPQYLVELRQRIAGTDTTPFRPLELMDILHKPSFPMEDYAGKPTGIDAGSGWYLLDSVNPSVSGHERN